MDETLKHILLTECSIPKYPRRIAVFIQHIEAIQEKIELDCDMMTEIHLSGVPEPIQVNESIGEILDKIKSLKSA